MIGYLLDFVEKTQKIWVGRGQKERWETAPPLWLQDPQGHVEDALLQLDLISAHVALKGGTKGHAWCVLGALYSGIQKRIHFLAYHMGQEPQVLLLLGGERPVGSPQDGTPEALEALKKALHRESLTEQDLLQHTWDDERTKRHRKGDVMHNLNVPRHNLPRPTTESTLVFLRDWLQDHSEIDSITFISSQPYILYQRAVIEQAWLVHTMHISFNVQGPQYVMGQKPPQKIQSLKKLVDGLGAFIWAQTPLVMYHLKLDPYAFKGYQERTQKLYAPESLAARIFTQMSSQKKDVEKAKTPKVACINLFVRGAAQTSIQSLQRRALLKHAHPTSYSGVPSNKWRHA